MKRLTFIFFLILTTDLFMEAQYPDFLGLLQPMLKKYTDAGIFKSKDKILSYIAPPNSVTTFFATPDK